MEVLFDVESSRDPGWRVQLILTDEVDAHVDDVDIDGCDDVDCPACSGDDDSAAWQVSGVPMWWLQNPSCDDHSDSCGCGELDLEGALAAVEDRDAALNAFMLALVELSAHEDTAANIADGFDAAPECAACLLHPLEHSLALADSVRDAAVQLVRVAARWGLRTHPSGRVDGDAGRGGGATEPVR